MAKDPRSILPKGRPGGSGASSGGRAKLAAAPKKKKQANGAAAAGYGAKKPPAKTRTAKQAKMKKPPINARRGDNTPGVTSYKYGSSSGY